MTTITSSPITFLDLTDQQQLSAYLTSNLPTVQVYGADGTYTPSWDENNLIITLHAFLNQEEIDYTNTDYKFTWSVKDGGREEVIKTGTDQTLIINSNKLLTSDTGMLTYICEIQCPTADTITTEMTYTLISDGKDGEDGKAVVFSVYSSDGTIFRNQSGEIKLETLKYYGSDEIVYNTGSQNPSFKWYKLSSDGETLISGATTDTYTVYGEDVLNIASYKCEMTYNDVVYSDVITLQDVSDNYTSDILTIGGTVFKNGIGGSAAYIIIRANGTEEDALAGIVSATAPSSPKTNDYWYCIDNSNDTIIKKKYTSGRWTNVSSIPQTLKYNWYLMDVDGNITKNFANEKVIYLSCTDVDDTTTLCCEVSSSDGKLLTISQETFVDLYDSYNVTITPDVVTVACDNNGDVIYKEGTGSVDNEIDQNPVLVYDFEYSVKVQNSSIDASCTIDAVEGLTIDTSQNGIIKITTYNNFNFGDADSFSLPVKITTNDKQNFTFERCITFIKIKEGESAISFNIYSPQGDTFAEGVEEITISTIAYCGTSLITDATYSWYYYEETTTNQEDNWHLIYEKQIVSVETTEEGDEITVIKETPAESQDLSINKNAYYAFLTLKCVMNYNGIYYEDYFLLKNYYNPYSSTIRFLNESNVIGVNDSFVVAYAELSKNNIIIDDLLAKEFYYNETIEITDGIINVDIIPENIKDQTVEYFKYFIYKSIDETNKISYPIILGKYMDNSWKVVENYNDYVYKNNLYPDLNSKIITIPKEEIEDSREITFYIYNTFENNEGAQVYDDDLLIAKSDTIIINLNDKLGEIVEVTKNVQEYMNFSTSDGLTIAQKESEDAAAKFYMNINSKQMAFHEVDDDGKDNEVVIIANNKADIKNLTVGADDKGDADFNCPISVNNQINIVNTSTSQTVCPGFSFQVEIDGSLSLIKMEVN